MENVTFIGAVVRKYFDNNGALYAAALSFYTVLAIAPLFVLFVGLGNRFIPGFESAFEGLLTALFEEHVTALLRFVEGYSLTFSTWWAAGLSVVLILFVATRLLNVLQTALNTIWETDVERGALLKRGLSLLLLVISGSVVIGVLIVQILVERFTSGVWFVIISNVTGFLVVFSLVSLVFMTVHDMQLLWSDVLRGSLITTVFFFVGESVIDVLIMQTGEYAFGSILVGLLIWVYYTWHSVLLGSQVAKVWVEG